MLSSPHEPSLHQNKPPKPSYNRARSYTGAVFPLFFFWQQKKIDCPYLLGPWLELTLNRAGRFMARLRRAHTCAYSLYFYHIRPRTLLILIYACVTQLWKAIYDAFEASSYLYDPTGPADLAVGGSVPAPGSVLQKSLYYCTLYGLSRHILAYSLLHILAYSLLHEPFIE